MYAQSNHLPTSHEKARQQSAQHLRCANCDIDILWLATIVQGKTYCCTGCAAGGPCNCDYSLYQSVSISDTTHYMAEYDNEQE